MENDNSLLPSDFSCKISTFPPSQPIHIFNIFPLYCTTFSLTDVHEHSVFPFCAISFLYVHTGQVSILEIWHNYVSVPLCWNKGLNWGWVDLESWQVHYCRRLCLAWHCACVPNLWVIWQSLAWISSDCCHTHSATPSPRPYSLTWTHTSHFPFDTSKIHHSAYLYEIFVKTIRTCIYLLLCKCLLCMCLYTHE